MQNGNLIYDGTKVAAYAVAEAFCQTMDWEERFFEELWEGLIHNLALYEEFIYFLKKGELTGNCVCHGYTMLDLYFYHLREYNMWHDIGKNSASCNKDEIVFRAFHTMGRLEREPEHYIEKLSQALGDDFM